MQPTATVTEQQIWQWLDQIPDPEVPVISIVELGVVRNVHLQDSHVDIEITPTYSGCPALKMMEESILHDLSKNGVSDVRIKTVLFPPWTTDWMSDETKEKLREYGIAPPEKNSKSPIHQLRESIDCPFCGSNQTRLQSAFGSTACKALYFCDGCCQPFEHFKCI
ncbi:MAG: 1,2-phenylacetyl-CoA epoxidase subunit PaaD [Calditrichia bacterium]